jgi:hypothetical protein
MTEFYNMRQIPTEALSLNASAIPEIVESVADGNIGRAVFQGIDGLVPKDGQAIVIDSAGNLKGRARISGETEIAGQDGEYTGQAFAEGGLDGFDAGVKGNVKFNRDLGEGLSASAGGGFNLSFENQEVGAAIAVKQAAVGDSKFSWQADAGTEATLGRACGSVSAEVIYGQTAGVFGRAAAAICTDKQNGVGAEVGVHAKAQAIASIVGQDLGGSFGAAVMSDVSFEAGVRVGDDNVFDESRSMGSGDATLFTRAKIGF